MSKSAHATPPGTGAKAQPSSAKNGASKLGRMPSIFTDSNTGKVLAANKRKLYELPFFIQTNPPNNVVQLGAGGLTTDPQTMRTSAEGPMQITAMGLQRTGTATAVLYLNDGSSPIRLMNSPCHVDTIFGNNGLMFPLPAALFIDENRALSITYTDLSGTTNAAQVALSAAKYLQLQNDAGLSRIKQRLQTSQYLSMPYFYTLDQGVANLTPLQTAQFEIQIDPAFHFEIHQLTFVSTGPFSINIVDEAKGESIINAPSNTNYPIPNLLLCGVAGHPYKFSESILTFAQQKLQITLQDTSGANNAVWLTISGKALALKQWS